jgi:hypothetical protein
MINRNVIVEKFVGFIVKIFFILAYDGPFSWRNYLTEKNEDPVPFECFNYVRTKRKLTAIIY